MGSELVASVSVCVSISAWNVMVSTHGGERNHLEKYSGVKSCNAIVKGKENAAGIFIYSGDRVSVREGVSADGTER